MTLMPHSLLGRTAWTIATMLLLFMVFSMGAAVYFIFIPMAKRSADDFAAEIVAAAHSLQSLPEEMHAELKQQLLLDHGLVVTEHTHSRAETPVDAPNFFFFRESLARRAGEDIAIIGSEKGPLVWVDVPAHGRLFRLGFDRERAGTNPPVVIGLAICGGAMLTLLASFLEVRKVIKPLEQLSATARELGHGQNPPPVVEEGPKEIAELARAFNRMASDLQAMSENRNVIIAGLSHDLRTPLTRLELATEMLSKDSEPNLVAAIRRDLAAMNKLIGQFLQFSRGIEDERPEDLDLWETIKSQAANLKHLGARIQLHRHNPPCVYHADPVALQRVLSNLLENAAHYGGGSPIDVNLHCTEEAVSIEICDRGPGIPADQIEAVFRPFHRLEQAHGSKSGGSGLGLAIARQLAVKHRWTIELLPREAGGTVAKLCLPPAQRRCLHDVDRPIATELA
jgi:two-component system osmolarity sensor histidine kinase EnvZ